MAGGDYGWMRKAGIASSIGLTMVASVLIGWYVGSWLDGKLGSSPWLMLTGTLMGIAAGFIEMANIAKRLSDDD
jgi:F0F1-type ATP synthase assembly protein I